MIRIDKSDLLLEVDERIFLPHFVAKFYTVDRHLSSVKREKPDKEEEDEEGNKKYYFSLEWDELLWLGKGCLQLDVENIIDDESFQLDKQYNEYFTQQLEYYIVSPVTIDPVDINESVIQVINDQHFQEVKDRVLGDQQLWDALNQEASARTEVDNQQWTVINQESQERIENVQQLWNGIDQEAKARQEIDNQQWDAINKESQDRINNVQELWDGINKEASARTDVDNQIWTAIDKEAKARQDNDNAINETIEQFSADTKSKIEAEATARQ